MSELEGFSRKNKQDLENSKKWAQENFDKLEAELGLLREPSESAKVEFEQVVDDLKEVRDEELEDLMDGSGSDDDDSMDDDSMDDDEEEEEEKNTRGSGPSKRKLYV